MTLHKYIGYQYYIDYQSYSVNSVCILEKYETLFTDFFFLRIPSDFRLNNSLLKLFQAAQSNSINELFFVENELY